MLLGKKLPTSATLLNCQASAEHRLNETDILTVIIISFSVQYVIAVWVCYWCWWTLLCTY